MSKKRQVVLHNYYWTNIIQKEDKQPNGIAIDNI